MSYSTYLKAKIHRATVTYTNRDYEGSLTLDARLMEEAGLLPFERIEVYNCSNGERYSTYLMPGESGSGVVGVNGAAAWKARVNDIVIIAAYKILEDAELSDHEVRLLHVDAKNALVERKVERLTRTTATAGETGG
ncbi:MAG: aspartate 1-decarboxylase [Acidobacteriota bacterium]